MWAIPTIQALPQKTYELYKINESIAFCVIMWEVGLLDHTMHNDWRTVNKILWEFYAQLEPPMEVQLAFSRMQGQVVNGISLPHSLFRTYL